LTPAAILARDAAADRTDERYRLAGLVCWLAFAALVVGAVL